MVSSSERGTEENGDKKNTLSKSSVFQQRTAALKPLCKHTFYLDVKNRSVISKIEGKIRALGGNIDVFLDEDVTHIVTDKEIPTNNKEELNSPITPTQLSESRHIGSHKGGNGGDKTPSHAATRLKTRVSAMLEKARGTPTHIEKDIFAEADRLSITVWTIKKALSWLDKVSLSLKPSSKQQNSSRYSFRSKYFIKFESFDRNTRPVFRELASWPHVNICGSAAGDGALVTVATPPVGVAETSEDPHRNMTRSVGHYGPTAAVPNVSSSHTTKPILKPITTSLPRVHRNNPAKARTPEEIPKGDEVQLTEAERTTTLNPIIILNLNQRLSSYTKKSSNRKAQAKKVQEKVVLEKNTKTEDHIDDNIPGYCELCRVNFTNQSVHFVAESHLKFVEDYKNYTEVDNLTSKESLEAFLKDNSYQDSALSSTFNGSTDTVVTMSSTRSSQRVSDLAPAAGATPRYGGGTSTRPRRHTTFTNSYLEISVDDDIMRPPECARETRETRSMRNIQMKADSPESETYWTSGRPKRACIKRKRSSSDDKPLVSTQSYYRVEVLGSKFRPNTCATTETSTAISVNSNTKCNKTQTGKNTTTRAAETTESKANSKEENCSKNRLSTHEEKGLFVKFRRMRNSELKQLNNEAVNFLFPKKDDSSSSEEDLDDNCPETSVSSCKVADISVVISSEDDETIQEINETDTKEQIIYIKKKEEIDTDENQSLDSNWSDSNVKKNQNHKRRRTHAEAFIIDNQKYYKFETPGSRLRYQGTFMSTHDLKVEETVRPRINGENPIDNEDSVESSEEDVEDKPQTKKLKLEDVKYSYELRPASEPWYQTFVRQDQGMENYNINKSVSETDYYKPFYLPHQLPPLQPLDPRLCFVAYDRLKRLILEEAGISLNNTPCSSTGNSTPTNIILTTTNGPRPSQQNGEDGQSADIANSQASTDILPDKRRVQEKILAIVKSTEEVNSVTGSDGGNLSKAAGLMDITGVDGLNDLIDVVDIEEGSNSNSSNSQVGISLWVTGDADGTDNGKLEKGKNLAVDGVNTNSVQINLEERRQKRRRQKRLIKLGTSSGRSPGRNARKSPRQHASTLAILSLLQQRKRRELNRSKSDLDNSNSTDPNSLDPIQEQDDHPPSKTHPLANCAMESSSLIDISAKPLSNEAVELAKLVSTVERMNSAIAAATDDIENFHVHIDVHNTENLLQSYSKTDAIAILEDYERYKDVQSKTGLSHGTNKRSYSPGKKPGRKRKKKRKNMTGWPNKNNRKLNTSHALKKELQRDDSTIDSLSVTADSEDQEDTNDISLATLPVDLNDSTTLKLKVDEYDLKMSISTINRLRLPSPKAPIHRNSRINSRSSAKSDKFSEKFSNKHFIKETKEFKDAKEKTSESVSNSNSTSLTTNCVYNNVSDNKLGIIKNTSNKTTVNNRVRVKEQSFSENDMEPHDSLSNCKDIKNKETKIIDLSHWREPKKPTRTINSETNSKSGTTSARLQPVVRVEKLNNRQLRSSGVSSSVRGSVSGKGTSVSRNIQGSPSRSVSLTRSSTPGSPSRTLNNSRGIPKQRASSRRMPASPKSPRVLRKPRGRWYRER